MSTFVRQRDPIDSAFLPTRDSAKGHSLFKIVKLPDIFIFQFKRSDRSYNIGKIDPTHFEINLPFEFDFTPYLVDEKYLIDHKMSVEQWKNKEQHIYKLYAAIRHVEDINDYGRYITIINVQMTGKWMIFDDEIVREPTDDEEIITILKNAYMVFYVRDLGIDTWFQQDRWRKTHPKK
jgi:ubiquitin C-terminal hydrolase